LTGYQIWCKIKNMAFQRLKAEEKGAVSWKHLKDKKRIVIKIGSSSLTHPETGELNLMKIEKLIRTLSDLRGQGKDVVLVSSGAIAAGRQALGHHKRPDSLAEKQAFAAVGQARLMMVYQKLCAEYNQTAAQVLLTKDTMVNDASRYNAQNTFEELLNLGTIPIVNENDTVSTSEIPYVDSFGDNDRLSAIVAALIGADLLILLSDIDGLYTDDPRTNKEARFISFVPEITKELLSMGKGTSGSDVGTGGMSAKLAAARIATDSGADMVIANGDHVEAVMEIVGGKETGTLFLAHTNLDFDLMHYLNNEY
jgi:glutamate 5-kinase